MMDTKNPQLRGSDVSAFDKRGVSALMCSCEIHESIIYHSCLVVQVRLFRSGKQTRSDLNEMTPIADSIPGCERIKTDIILTCIPGVVLQISNLREILPIWQGSRFVFKKLKEVNK